MRIHYFLFCFATTIICSTILTISHHSIASEHFKQETANVIEKTILNRHFSINSITDQKNRMTIYLTAKQPFTALNYEDQFVYLSQFHRLIRYHLKNGIQFNPYYAKDIQIKLDVNKTIYTYKDVHDERNSLYKHKGLLQINDLLIREETIVNSPTFMEKYILSFIDDKTSNGYSEYDVLDYTERFTKVITNNGRNISFKNNNTIISNEITRKFDLTMQEIMKIFHKWYFFLFDFSSIK